MCNMKPEDLNAVAMMRGETHDPQSMMSQLQLLRCLLVTI